MDDHWRIELKHIEDVKLQDVKDFFFKHYTPSNAVLVVAGNVNAETVKTAFRKMVWFNTSRCKV